MVPAVACDLMRGCERLVVAGSVPIGRPLPNVAGHVKQSKAVEVNVPTGAVPTKPSAPVFFPGSVPEKCSPGICPRLEIITPDEPLAIQATARGEFELSFCRQTLTGPLRIRFGILVGDMDHRMFFLCPADRSQVRLDAASWRPRCSATS